MQGKRKWIFIVTSTAIVLVGLAVLTKSLSDPSDVSSPLARQGRALPQEARTSTSAAPESKGVAKGAKARDAAPLPPLGAPLHHSFAQLKRRADTGEPAAACRLAAELERCNNLMTRLSAVEAATRRREAILKMRPADGAWHADTLAAMDDANRAAVNALAAESEHCDQAPQLGAVARAAYWRTAALGGHIPAMRHYAVGNAFQWRELLNALPALTLYRAEGERIARQAAAAGDTATILALAAAYSPRDADSRGHFLAQIVREDAPESLALYQLLRRSVEASPVAGRAIVLRELDRIIHNLQSGMTSEQITRSDRLMRLRSREWTAPAITPAIIAANWEAGTTPAISAADCMTATPDRPPSHPIR